MCVALKSHSRQVKLLEEAELNEKEALEQIVHSVGVV